MHKHFTCTCGHMVHADSDDDMVRRVQDHKKREHGENISREEVLKMAKDAQH